MEEVYLSNKSSGVPQNPATADKQTEITNKLEEIEVLLTLPQDLTVTGSPTFAGETLTGLTASRIVATDGGGVLVSIDSDITAAQLEELSDGSETALHSHVADAPAAHTIVSHSDTTATGAELEELTDSSETTLHSHAAAPSRGLSAYTNLDSESQAMLYNHAYLAMTDGMVFAYKVHISTQVDLQLHVGTTNDPAGAGTLIASSGSGSASSSDQSVCALVAEGEYFEISGAVSGAVINWKSFGTLSAPVDQD